MPFQYKISQMGCLESFLCGRKHFLDNIGAPILTTISSLPPCDSQTTQHPIWTWKISTTLLNFPSPHSSSLSPNLADTQVLMWILLLTTVINPFLTTTFSLLCCILVPLQYTTPFILVTPVSSQIQSIILFNTWNYFLFVISYSFCIWFLCLRGGLTPPFTVSQGPLYNII